MPETYERALVAIDRGGNNVIVLREAIPTPDGNIVAGRVLCELTLDEFAACIEATTTRKVRRHYDRTLRWVNDFGTSYMAAVPFLSIILDKQIAATSKGFPRFWDQFRFLLPEYTRTRIYEPAYCDLLALYLEARQERYQTKWGRRWLLFCFTVQSLWLIVKCCRAAVVGTAAAALGSFIKSRF